MVRFTALLASLVLTALGSTAFAQGRIVARHGDWQIRCEKPVGAPSEQCALIQNVQAQDRPNVALTAIFLLTADRQARILRVLAPLGVLLPSGLGLSIDDNEVGLAGFVRCLPEGCIAEVELDDGLVERFQAGETATFVIFQTPEEGIGIPISLDGFTAGFAALADPPPPPSETDIEPAPAAPPAPAPTTAVSAAVSGERFGAAPPPPDGRSEFDRLLEDELFPYVAGGALAVLLLVVGAVLLLVRGRRRRRRAAGEAAAASEAAGRSERVPPRLAASEPERQVESEPARTDRERRPSSAAPARPMAATRGPEGPGGPAARG